MMAVRFCGSCYGESQASIVFDTEQQALTWQAQHETGVIWQAVIDLDEQAVGDDAA